MYTERQTFRKVWYIIYPTALILIGLFGVFVFGIYQQLVIGVPFGSKPMSDSSLVAAAIFSLLIGAAAFSVLYFTKLEVEIDRSGIRYRYVPFLNSFKTISPSEIKHFEVGSYSPIMEFGGWGVRMTIRKKAFTVSGNKALKLEMNDGKKIYLGTKRPDELRGAMEQFHGKINH